MALTKVKGNVIEDGSITDSKFPNTEITSADMALDPRNASNISSGQVPLAQLGNLPAADLTGLNADIAVVGFKIAANGSLSKYNLIDQTVDVFEDATGVDASASTGEYRNSAGKYYSGSTTVGPTGGTVVSYTVGATNYKSNTFTSTGNLVVPSSGNVDYLIVAGGGGGGNGGANTGNWGAGGGGGAGGVLTGTALALTAQTYTITVGDGGAGGGFQVAAENAASGDNSSIVPVTSGTSYIAIGGGGAANSYGSSVGLAGGSGGGGSYAARASGAGTAGPPRQGYDGGTNTFVNSGAGGGGAGAQGGAAANPAGAGGTGISNSYRDGVAGTTIGTHYFAGGGGAGSYNGTFGTGSYGGGNGGLVGGTLNGTSNGVPATINSGGGGGGGSPENIAAPTTGGAGGDGGKGIVVVRYEDTEFSSIGNMTLVSNLTAAQTAPTKGDIVFTYSNGAGTTVINTNVTAEVSADNGSTWTLFSGLTSQGTTGGNTIVSAHDQTITSTITAPYNMRYRIKTLVQSAAMDTRIHAVSLGWS